MNGWSTALLIVGILFLVFIVILLVMRRRRNRAIGGFSAARGGSRSGRYATGEETGTDTIPGPSPLKFPEKNTYEKFYDVFGDKLYDAEPKVRDELESTFYDAGSLKPYPQTTSITSITSITPEEEDSYSGGGYAGDKYLSGLKDQYN